MAEEKSLTFFKLTRPEGAKRMRGNHGPAPDDGGRAGMYNRGGGGTWSEKRLAALVEKREIALEDAEVRNNAAILDAVVNWTPVLVGNIHYFPAQKLEGKRTAAAAQAPHRIFL